MIISVLEKVLPAAAKELSKKTLIEVVGAASIGAGGVNFILDKTVGPVVEKGTNYAKDKFAAWGTKKQEKLEARKAAILEKKKNEMIEVPAEEVEDGKVEDKPNKASNRKNK